MSLPKADKFYDLIEDAYDNNLIFAVIGILIFLMIVGFVIFIVYIVKSL